MNISENKVKARLEAEGFKVLRGGAPDFIALTVTNGEIISFKGVEVKTKEGKLSYEQEIYRKIFELAGVPYEVMISDNLPNHTNPNHSKPSHATPCQAMPLQTIPIQSNIRRSENGKEV